MIDMIVMTWNPDTLLEENPMLHFYMHFVFWSTIISIAMPPIELFNKFPKFQAAYQIAVNIVQYYCSLAVRGKIAQAYQNLKGGGNSNELSSKAGPDTGQGTTGDRSSVGPAPGVRSEGTSSN